MRATFADRKFVFIVDHVPEACRYALDASPPKQPTWDNCREQFAHKMTPETPGFFFSHQLLQTDNIAGFMAKSEEILELPERSVYRHTEHPLVFWIEPSRFWMNCWMKRSFLTILLRCGMFYDPDRDNYEDSLFGTGEEKDKVCEYMRITRPAVMRFFFGFTKFIPPVGVEEPTGTLHKNLWVEVLKGRSVKELKTILVAENPKSDLGLLGIDAIWA